MPEETPLTPAVFHILLALESGPSHGYGIMKQVEIDAGLEMGPGTIYGSIQRLRDVGWVASAHPDPRNVEDRRRGRTFELTDEGRRALLGEARRIRRLAAHEAVERLVSDGG